MDPEIQRDYEEHMRTMVELLNQQAAATSKLLNSLQSTSSATAAVKNNTDATKKQTEVLSGSTRALEAGAAAQQKYAEAAANFSKGLISGQSAVLSFGKAMLTAEKNLEKYGSAFNSAGSAAWDIGKNFGILGMAAGGVAKGFGAVASGVFEAVDSVVKFRDETSKFAGILPTTLSGMQELGSNARFSGAEIMKLSKTMSGFGSNILSLGGSAGENAVKFMEMAAVTDNVRRQFGRLGVDQDRLLEMQGMYIQMQGVSGKALENRTKTEAQLQRESLAYAKNLIIMSDLTGQTAEQMQQEREVVKAEFEEQVKIRQENIQIQRLRAAREHEAADAIKKEQDNRTTLIQTMTDTYGKEIGSQFGRMARTGVIDRFTGGLATLGVSATEVSNMVKTSGNIQADSFKQAQKMSELQNNMVEAAGDSLQFMGEESAKNLGITNETITRGNRFFGKNLEEEVEKSKKAAAEKEAEGDAIADAVEQVRSSEREIQKLYYDSMFDLAEIVLPKFAGALEWATEKLLEIINYVKTNFDDIVKQIQKWGPIIAAVAGGLIGLKIALTVTRVFKGLASGANSLTKVFSGLRGALGGAIKWLKGLIGMGSAKTPTKGPVAKGGASKAPDVAKGGKALKLAKGLFGGLGSLVGGLALDYGSEKAAEAGHTKTAAGLSVGSSAATGAGMGAMLGSVVPGVGTVVGGAVGGLLGGAYGLYQNWDGLTGGPEQEKAKVEKETAEKNKASADKSSTSSAKAQKSAGITEKSANLNKKTTDHFGKMVAAFGKIVAANGKIVVAFAGLIKLFGESVKTFETTIKELVDNLSTMTGVSSDAGGGAASGENIPQNVQGNLEAIAQGMRKKGFGDENYINAVLGNVMKESGGRFDRQEDLAGYKNTSNARIRNIFGSRASGKTDAELDAIKSDPKMMGEMMYGSSTKKGRQMGNTEPGDGWKYRGRGPIQLTGKSNYAKASKDIYGDDRLVKDPDLVLQPDVGVEVVAWFMQQNEKSMRKQLGFSPDQALSQQEAALLATSQIAGQKITRGSGYLGTENLQKAESFAAAMPTGVGAGGRFSSGGQRGAANPASKELISTKPSNVKLGDKADLSGMDSNLLSRFFTAAKEFGQNININSAYRNDDYQAQLWVRGNILGEKGIYTPARPKDDTTITYKGKQYTVEGSGTGSRHGRGEALDISTNREAFDPILAKYGLHRPFVNDPPHVELKARKGGVFTGPDSGYPIELHGQEIVAPLTADSVLMKLAKTPAISTEGGRLEASATSLGGGSTAGTGNVEAIVKMHSDLIGVLTTKLDSVIDALDEGNSTRVRIFRNSVV